MRAYFLNREKADLTFAIRRMVAILSKIYIQVYGYQLITRIRPAFIREYGHNTWQDEYIHIISLLFLHLNAIFFWPHLVFLLMFWMLHMFFDILRLLVAPLGLLVFSWPLSLSAYTSRSELRLVHVLEMISIVSRLKRKGRREDWENLHPERRFCFFCFFLLYKGYW